MPDCYCGSGNQTATLKQSLTIFQLRGFTTRIASEGGLWVCRKHCMSGFAAVPAVVGCGTLGRCRMMTRVLTRIVGIAPLPACSANKAFYEKPSVQRTGTRREPGSGFQTSIEVSFVACDGLDYGPDGSLGTTSAVLSAKAPDCRTT
jgi:hypothetical protein